MENRWIAWGLAAVLVLQVYTLRQFKAVEHLRSEVTALRSQVSKIDSRTNGVANQLSQLNQANEWVVNPRVQVAGTADCTAVNASLDWSFRELEAGAEVELLYRGRGASAWQSAQASPNGADGYRAHVTLPVELRGSPEIQISRRVSSGGFSGSTSTATAAAPFGPYEYRIVARTAAGTRSSDPRPLHVDAQTRIPFQIVVSAERDNRYRVAVHGRFKPGHEPCATVKAAAVKGYRAGTVVTEQTLQPVTPPDAASLRVEFQTAEALDRIDLIVTYGNGKSETHTVNIH